MRRSAFLKSSLGQSTVEAALLLPAFFVTLALLIQPAIVLYSKVVMNAVVAETCRVYGVQGSAGSAKYAEDRYREFMLRRLRAVPPIDIFHVGGEDGWTIEFALSDETALVGLEHEVKLLPLLGIAASPFGRKSANGNLIVRSEASLQTRPDWVKGTYGEWQSMWE